MLCSRMAVQFKDYYETLGVERSAAPEEIKKAFRKLARQHHPDVSKDKKSAEAKFKEINEAYEVLGDPEKRKKYDTMGADWDKAGPPPGWGDQGGGGRPGTRTQEYEFGGTGFSDFFENFFGGGGRAARNPFDAGFRGAPQPPAGVDVEADIMVTLEEALHGSRRKVSFRRSSSSKVETYEVQIPAGVHEGQRIRLAGQGEAQTKGGVAGDLYLRVRLSQHPDFRVDGKDLVHDLDLPPWRAVLGGEVPVPTMEGEARLKIPAGTQNGQRFKLKRRGMPQKGQERGDLYVAVEIVLPKELNEQERALWEQLARDSRNPAV